MSHPGPDPSISDEDIKVGRMISRRYRNRRIGEFLKELEFTEGRGTGVPKMRRALKNNGSPSPVFFTDAARQSFWTEIKIHPEFIKNEELTSTSQLTHQVTHQVTLQVILQILLFCKVPRKAVELLKFLGLKDRGTLRNNYLRPLIEDQLIALTIPDKPNSRLQQYIITAKGIALLQKEE